jgi:hypothetical protein
LREIRSREVRPSKVRSAEVRLGEVRAGEVSPGEVRPAEVRSSEVWLSRKVPPPPGVPSCRCTAHGFLGHHYSVMLASHNILPTTTYCLPHRWGRLNLLFVHHAVPKRAGLPDLHCLRGSRGRGSRASGSGAVPPLRQSRMRSRSNPIATCMFFRAWTTNLLGRTCSLGIQKYGI